MIGRRMIGGGFAGGLSGALIGAAVLAMVTAGCGGDAAPSEPLALAELPDSGPGEVVALVATETEEGRFIEWADRLDGTIRRLDIDGDDDAIEVIARIDVSTDGEQRGLLGQVVIRGRRFASWTQPGTNELVVGEVVEGAAGPIVWSAGEAGSGAIGGVLKDIDGDILLGLGRNTEWDRETQAGGAIIRIDRDDRVAVGVLRADVPPPLMGALSEGYTNPWAFEVVRTSGEPEIWVADNAAGPDPDDDSVDDIERIGRADLVADRADMTRIVEPGRAPSAMVELPDGRLGICGFLDNELRAYEVIDTEFGERTGLERAGTIMPCLTGAAVFDDGTIVTASLGDPGTQLNILRP